MLALLTEEQEMLQEIAAQLAQSMGLTNPSDLEKVDRAKGWAALADAMRLERLKKATVSARSKISSWLRPCCDNASRSASSTRCGVVVSFQAKSSINRCLGSS